MQQFPEMLLVILSILYFNMSNQNRNLGLFRLLVLFIFAKYFVLPDMYCASTYDFRGFISAHVFDLIKSPQVTKNMTFENTQI